MYTIGIDLGGTNIAVGIVDENYNIVLKDSVPTNATRSAQEIAQSMADLSLDLVRRAGLTIADIKWAGLGTPGTANAETGFIEYSNNLPFENLPIVKILGELMHVKVYIENDANAAAFGEFMAGAAKGSRSAVAITLGTGLGGGIIIDGKIFQGSNYAGAELGHTVMVVDGPDCTCGRKGCFEVFSSATGLIRMTREAMQADPETAMWKMTGGSLDKVSGKTAFQAMYAGDATGKEVVDEYIRYLGIGLANVINIFQPEILCIGGGICKEGDNLIKPLEKIIEKERYSRHSAKQTKLCVASLGNDAGIIGAALLGLNA